MTTIMLHSRCYRVGGPPKMYEEILARNGRSHSKRGKSHGNWGVHGN